MDRFQAMQVFTRVVDANSFSRAADSLGLPRATVTNIIQNLERLLQVRLLNRSTRRLSLTQDGAAYYERCVAILADVEETESSFRDAASGPRGRLRIDVPASLGRLVLIPRLCDFHTRYPELEIAIGMTDRPVDMVREAVDCALRVGHLPDSSLVARRIGTFFLVTCAAPSYLERHGEPRTIAELANHSAVNYFSSLNGRTLDWDFVVDGHVTEVKMKGVVSVNDGDAYLACALQGFGMVQMPRFMALPHLESGALREVLPQWSPAPMPISAVYPANRHLSPKVRAFVDWVAELFAACPLLGGTAAVDYCCSYEGKPAGNTLRSVVEQHNLAESAL
ncbi:LysR family transcriptional regulator [Azoarcus olearius]|uniref:LysR-family transcriptional regulator protein n=1 Tax=Azoarcus sp. (strain BH72) TaxID=418699 RepID=A1K8M9_AZOSB|nr:LysR family transcriptional regulator [Azoarcus olearius]CAL95184.1 putative LysR-family transcriptional regulator protein [Azoarcus olearius]